MNNKEKILKRVLKIEDKLLVSRCLDRHQMCENSGKIVNTDFIDPHQKKLMEDILTGIKEANYKFHGGMDGAEREVLFFCPDFIFQEDEDFQGFFKILKITTKSREKLSHRDYLGALMGLGIKREKTGDIFVLESGAYLIVLKEIADFILYNFHKVGNAKIEIQESSMEDIEIQGKETKDIHSTVASLRLDSVAGTGFGISRTKMTEYIKGEKVRLNWEVNSNPAYLVKEGDTLSLRGKGRIVLETVGNTTRKGRIAIVLKRLRES